MLQKGLMVFEVMMNLVYNLRLFFEWPKFLRQLQSQTKIVGTLKPNADFSVLVLPSSLSKLFIAVWSPNLVHQHWGDKETPKCPNHFHWDCSIDDARGVVNSIRLIYSYYRYFLQLLLQQSILKSVFSNTNKIKRNKINILTYPK